MRAAVVLLTRDLRVHDNPALSAALAEAETVLPLFVHDDRIAATRNGAASNRHRFLLDSLADLDTSLRARGARLVVRRGDVVAETVNAARDVGAEAVFIGADVSSYAREREQRLGTELPLRVVNTHFVVEPGEIAPARKDHYRVFTPYFTAWCTAPVAPPLPAPTTVKLPATVSASTSDLPGATATAAESHPGGENAGRARMSRWLDEQLDGYGEGGHDDLGADTTSHLSPYLHFGCVSARELALEARQRGGTAFVRQLCWRDFFAQLLLANPRSQSEDLRPRGDRWADSGDAVAAWKEGATGFPLVDAGMRQLAAEGWMHNRARLVVASFLTKDLGVDWRVGAAHFFDLLLDGDIAQNVGNWQWVAGTGADTRSNRILNPSAQLAKHDRNGAYVRRYVTELADVPAASLREPGGWAPGYPPPIVDHTAAAAAFRARRAGP